VPESSTVTLVGRFQDDITPGLQRAQSEIANTRVSIDKMGPAERAWSEEIQRVRTSIIEQRDALVLRKEALDDPATRRAIKEAAQLHDEINKLTKAEVGNAEAVQLTSRSRKELIVLMHELSQGRYKNFGGSLMVLEEGNGGITGAVKAATAMLGGPYVVAAGLAAVATTGVAVALWKASEAEAEMVHKTNLLGQTLGVSGEAIRGFQYLAVGTGVTTEELGRVFGIFEKNLGKNTEKFRELGITARDPLAAFEQVMDRAKGMGDAVERNTFLNEALGRGWEKIAPVIMQGGDAAKEAIEKMRIPEDTLANFERANKAQIEIDKSFLSIKLHAGEAFSGIRAGFKELEADGAKLAENHGLIAALGALTFRGRALANAERARNPTEGLGPAAAPVMSDEQIAALKEADKTLAKGSLDIAIQGVKDEWKSRIDLFKAGTPEYLKEVKAEAEAEAEVRKSFAKKNRVGSISDGKSGLYTHSTGKNSVALNDPEEFRVNPDRDHEANLEGKLKSQKVAADNQKKWIKEATDAQANSAKITLNWDGAIANARKREHDEHMKRIQAEGDLIQGFAAKELTTALQGGMTKKQLEKDFSNFLIQQIVERGTKWVEEEAIKLAFSEGASSAATATSVVQAGIASSAWSAPSMMASIGTFGGATAAGEASWFQAMAAGQAFGMAAHAKGGLAFGPSIFGESGPERGTPVVPTQITTASHTTNNNGGNTYHIYVNGGDAAAIAADLPRALASAQRTRAQSSRGG
jgi:hypothetical protein